MNPATVGSNARAAKARRIVGAFGSAVMGAAWAAEQAGAAGCAEGAPLLQVFLPVLL